MALVGDLNDRLPLGVSLPNAPQRFAGLWQRIATLNDGLRLPSLDELLQELQVFAVGRTEERLQALACEQRRKEHPPQSEEPPSRGPAPRARDESTCGHQHAPAVGERAVTDGVQH